jgi:hypothetical protein
MADVSSPKVAYDDAVQRALGTMCRLMNSRDNDVAFKSAAAVLEIEKARLRHKMTVAGTEPTQQPPAVPAPQDATPKLTEGEVQQFETALEEFHVVINRNKAKEGLPAMELADVRLAYELKLNEVGFDEFVKWHQWLMEMERDRQGHDLIRIGSESTVSGVPRFSGVDDASVGVPPSGGPL